MKIFLGADHRGYKLKGEIAKWLRGWGYEFQDLGAERLDPNDDYPLYAEKVSLMVRDTPYTLGILLCGSGIGVNVVANKFDGVRAGVGKTPEQVRAGRRDDDMNILVIAADFTKDEEAKKIVKAFLETKFDGKERYKRRLREVGRIEKNN